MSRTQSIKTYSPREYYELEQSATYKSEYYRGEIFAMAGGTVRHSLICMNVGGEVRSRLKGKPCVPYESNLRLKITLTGLRCYPDASVYCDPLEYDDDDPRSETVTNPTVLFEVLSPSTEAYDRGSKSENFRLIASLRAYVLISTDKPHVEIFERQMDGSWSFREVSGDDKSLQIPPLKIELPLAEIYARVDFDVPDSQV